MSTWSSWRRTFGGGRLVLQPWLDATPLNREAGQLHLELVNVGGTATGRALLAFNACKAAEVNGQQVVLISTVLLG